MQTTVTELPGSRVRVEVEVPAGDVDRGAHRAARAWGQRMRRAAFSKGKAPPSLVIQRLGFGAVLEEALRDSLPEWYERALLSSGINPVGDPRVEIVSAPQGEGEPLEFKFEVGVRPQAKLGEYKGLEVGKGEPEIPEDIVEREIERIREGFAKLEPVERVGGEGDVLLVDFEGLVDGQAFEGGQANDYLLELGGGQLVEGFEEQLYGAAAGEERAAPEREDDLAAEASEFDTLDELRADIREKVAEVAGQRLEEDFRIAAVDAAVDTASVELPDELAAARAGERWERVERQLAARGMSPDAYLQMQGKTREQVIEESKPDAVRELKREAVLAAIAEEEGIEVSEEEMVEALAHTAEHERTTPEKLLGDRKSTRLKSSH